MKKLKQKMGAMIQRIVDWGMGNGLMQEELSADGHDMVTPEMAELARRAGAEGCVLLKNDGTLPLQAGKTVAVFGRCQLDWFYVGYGSGGDVNPPYRVDLMEGLKNAGIPFDPTLVEETKGYSMKDAYTATQRLLNRNPNFTALFTISDTMGIAAMKALHNGGISVPEECSVIAIDGIEVTKYTIPALTTLIQPRKPMGTEAVRILVEVIRGKANCQLRLETQFREGETLAPPPH